jgi:Mg2+ and Co2+ transporter CorA
MPETDWHFGYGLAVTCTAVSTLGTYWYFKKKNWM